MMTGGNPTATATAATVAGAHATLVRRLYELIDGGDVAGLAALFASDAVYHRPGYPPLTGAAAIDHFYRHDRVIESGRHTLHAVLSGDHAVAVRGVFSGVLRDGRLQEHHFAEFFTIGGDGLISRRDTFFHVPLV